MRRSVGLHFMQIGIMRRRSLIRSPAAMLSSGLPAMALSRSVDPSLEEVDASSPIAALAQPRSASMQLVERCVDEHRLVGGAPRRFDEGRRRLFGA